MRGTYSQLLCLALALLATQVTVADDDVPVVCIGTSEDSCDIIQDSQVTDKFRVEVGEDDTESDENLYTVAGDADSMDLFVTVKSGKLDGTKLFAVSEDGATEPKIAFPKHGKSIGTGDGAVKGTLTFNCGSGGSSVVTVMLVAKNFASDSSKITKDMKPEEVMSTLPGRFKVKKTCADAQAAQDAIVAPWFNMCDEENVKTETIDGKDVKRIDKSNVVWNGKVSWPYTLQSDDNTDNLKVIPADKDYIEFYMGTKPGEKVEFGAPIVLTEAGITRPVLSGSGINGGTLTNDGSWIVSEYLVVTFNCRATGSSPVSLTIPILPEGSATLSVMKECKVDEDETVVKQEWSLPGLTIKNKGGDVIAKNGLTVDDFTETGAATARAAIVSPSVSEYEFTIVMDKDSAGVDSQVLDPPVIFVTDPAILAASIETPVLKVTQDPQSFVLSMDCAAKGSTIVTVTLPIPDEVGELKFSIQKICEPDELEKAEAEKEKDESKVNQQNSGINVGTSMDSLTDVVQNGLASEWAVSAISKNYGPSMEKIKSNLEDGAVSFECESCMPSTFETLPEAKGAIATCEAKSECSIEESKTLLASMTAVVKESLASANPKDAAVIPEGTYSMDFFISVSPNQPEIHLGHAEAYSLDESVSQPRLLGPGSSSTKISAKPSRLAVAFDCAGAGGTTIVVVKLPVFAQGKKSAVVTYGMVKQCAAINATEFGGSNADNPEMSMEIEEVVQRAGSGLNVGTGLDSETATDVVSNGIVMPLYLTSSKAGNQDAGGQRIDADTQSFKLYVSSAEPEGAEPITVGIPQVVSFNPKVAKVSITEESALSKKYASKGKFKLEEPLELVLNFECLSTGVAVIAIGIPLRTRGTGAHFEFSKACETTYEPTYTGDKIEGFKVGVNSGGDEVVRDGQVSFGYSRTKSTKNKADKIFVSPTVKSSTFYLSADPGIEIGDPVAVAHRPIISPTLSGVSAGPLGNEKSLTVQYNCVWEGQTQLTIVVPLVNMEGGQKHIVWAVTKRCSNGGSDVDNSINVNIEQMDLFDHDNDGVLGPEYEEWMDWADYDDDNGWDEFEAYDFEEEWDYYDYWDPWENMDNDEYFDDWYDNFDEDAYFWYDEEYDYDYAEFDDFWEYGDYDDYDSLLGTLNDEGWDVQNDLTIGTHEGKSDVVDAGYTQPRYKMCEPEPGLPCDIQAMINSELVTFYVRSVQGEEYISQVEAKPKYKGSVEAKVTNLKQLIDSPVFPDSHTEIEIEMTCLRQGVTSPVLVTVFYDHNISFESFSIIKVCGKQVSAAAVAIETTTLLIGFGVLASVVLSFIAGHKLKKFSDGRDLSA